ncbi:hypothetical protein FALBO_3967 [Fusarium albosuccineum]|uniref:Uncharacterized protein n=1 Tax=Fusarium albosuccineum TaxID=1237068 RepID=A0A8H4LIS9_9HYPO|nr:hypothetical protein FALBO_3967 [Fusarium albosuccineum]
MKSILLLGALWSAQAAAQRYTYTTQTITECFSSTQSDFGPAAPTQGSGKYWTVEMPECHDCHCPDCTYTHTYTTTLDVFSPHGLVEFPYAIKEIYRGMSAMPADATPTAIPYGFTSGVETCNICGDEPMVATMTYPRGGSPYQASATAPASAVETKFERPSTLQTKVASQEATAVPSDSVGHATLEKTVLEHKVTKFEKSGKGADFSNLGLESDPSQLEDEDDEPNSSSTPSDKIKNFSNLRLGASDASDSSDAADAAPSKDSDNGGASLRPPVGAGIALLLPLALML